MNKIKSPKINRNLSLKLSIQNLFKFTLVTILGIGCFWQILTISEFYFNYPTNVFIETKFDAIQRQLPAISFCHYHPNASNSDQIFERYSVEHIFKASLSNSENQDRDLSGDFWPNKIEMVTREFYCFTLNSNINGNIYEKG